MLMSQSGALAVPAWGSLPGDVQKEFLEHSEIEQELRYLKPNVIILGLDLKKATGHLPIFQGLQWYSLCSFPHGKGEIIEVLYSWANLDGFEGDVLIINSMANPFPFQHLSPAERKEVGNKIKIELESHAKLYK